MNGSAVDQLRALADSHGCELVGGEHRGQFRVEARPRAGGPFRVVAYGPDAEAAARAALLSQEWRKSGAA